MTIAEYRAHLAALADETFLPKNDTVWRHLRSKRSRELNKAVLRLDDEQLAEFRERVDPLKTPAYTIRDIINNIRRDEVVEHVATLPDGSTIMNVRSREEA